MYHVDSKVMVFYTQRPITPGSAVINTTWNGAAVYTDNGDGTASHSSGTQQYDSITIDYARGVVEATLIGTSGYEATMTVDYTPAAAFIGQAESGMIDVTQGNRSFSWTLNLAASKPRPGTLVIFYLAQGKWQTLADSGNGVLEGEGSGSITFATGSVAITFPVMPDVGSAIVYAYIADVVEETTRHSGLTADKPQVQIQLTDAIKPGSITISWNDGAARSATDDGAGNMTGDAVGTVVYGTGEVTLEATGTFLNISTELTVDYENDTSELEAVSFSPDSNGVVTGTLANYPILAGSLSFEVTSKRKRFHSREPDRGAYLNGNSYTEEATVTRKIRDDGAGGFKDHNGSINGSINYTTGAYTVELEAEYTYGTVVGTTTGLGGRGTKTLYGQQTPRDTHTSATNIRYQLASASHNVGQQIRDATSCVLKLLATPASVVPGSGV